MMAVSTDKKSGTENGQAHEVLVAVVAVGTAPRAPPVGAARAVVGLVVKEPVALHLWKTASPARNNAARHD